MPTTSHDAGRLGASEHGLLLGPPVITSRQPLPAEVPSRGTASREGACSPEFLPYPSFNTCRRPRASRVPLHRARVAGRERAALAILRSHQGPRALQTLRPSTAPIDRAPPVRAPTSTPSHTTADSGSMGGRVKTSTGTVIPSPDPRTRLAIRGGADKVSLPDTARSSLPLTVAPCAFALFANSVICGYHNGPAVDPCAL